MSWDWFNECVIVFESFTVIDVGSEFERFAVIVDGIGRTEFEGPNLSSSSIMVWNGDGILRFYICDWVSVAHGKVGIPLIVLVIIPGTFS